MQNTPSKGAACGREAVESGRRAGRARTRSRDADGAMVRAKRADPTEVNVAPTSEGTSVTSTGA